MSGGGALDSVETSRECFEEAVGWLKGPEAVAMSHGELEDQLGHRGRELLRRMYQDHSSLRATNEARLVTVLGAESCSHGAVETGHRRPLGTVFGEVSVERFAYRHRGHPNLYPADGLLNLPAEHHSHGLRRLVAQEATRGSFEEAGQAVERATGVHVAKRQVEALAARAATDVEEFYDKRARQRAKTQPPPPPTTTPTCSSSLATARASSCDPMPSVPPRRGPPPRRRTSSSPAVKAQAHQG